VTKICTQLGLALYYRFGGNYTRRIFWVTKNGDFSEKFFQKIIENYKKIIY